MHADELDIDVELVRSLLAAQLPQWHELPVARVPSFGTDNALFRLGDELVVRMPRVERAVPPAVREFTLVAALAPHLRVAIPKPVAEGVPSDEYPWPWFVYRWIEGGNPRFDDADFLVEDVAAFVNAMRRIDATAAPDVWRGRPLATQDAAFRRWLAAQNGDVDTVAAQRVWDSAVRAEPWSGAPMWFHGDLMSGNLLVRDRRLVAVIDFATAGAGDPAIDLLPAWQLFGADARERFRILLGADDAMWERSRGWAVMLALGAVAYYRETNDLLYSTGRRALDALLG